MPGEILELDLFLRQNPKTNISSFGWKNELLLDLGFVLETFVVVVGRNK